jgi:hypothetical protein
LNFTSLGTWMVQQQQGIPRQQMVQQSQENLMLTVCLLGTATARDSSPADGAAVSREFNVN